jgi:hypothetical protein
MVHSFTDSCLQRRGLSVGPLDILVSHKRRTKSVLLVLTANSIQLLLFIVC